MNIDLLYVSNHKHESECFLRLRTFVDGLSKIVVGCRFCHRWCRKSLTSLNSQLLPTNDMIHMLLPTESILARFGAHISDTYALTIPL